MITSDSRYTAAAHESAQAHTYDEAGVVETNEDGNVNTPSRDTIYLMPTRYSLQPPLQYMAKMTDNIQLLAYRTQQDPSRWWVIADANTYIWHPLDLEMGDLLHIPE
jgi:hypothetical protein